MHNLESNIYVPGWEGQVPLLTGEDFEAAATGAYNLGKAYLLGTNQDSRYATFSIYSRKDIGIFVSKDFGSAKLLSKVKLPRSKKEKPTQQLELFKAVRPGENNEN